MSSYLATPPAAPPPGAAEQAAVRRARLLALTDARDQAAHAAARRCWSSLAPPSPDPLSNPATDPARWQGFI